MFKWLPYPFLRILLFFITGIVAGLYTSVNISVQAGILSILVLFLLFIGAGKIKSLKNPVIAGLLAFSIIALTGFIHVNNYESLPALSQDARYFMATISGYPEEKENSIKYQARVNKISSDGETWSAAENNVLLYIDKSATFFYGDVLIIKSALHPIEGPKNPGEFNYKKYLLNQGIQAQAFISAGDLQHMGHQPGSSIIQAAFKVRKWVEQAVDEHFTTQEASIMKALLVGIRSDMDDQLKKDYAAAGAVHILAVSGLHVGIVYGLLLWTLGWLRNLGYGKLTFAVIALVLLWFYAFVTGFSPSILRAVLMFSFIIVSQAINRGSNIYNSIAASAFFLLVFNPLLILNVGFQLSYLAVVGIVYLYPKIVWLLEFNNVVLDRIWQMSVVGIAAQIATFPIVLYYFHQFPTWFMLSNLFVVPAASIILCSGLFFLAVQSWSLLAEWVADVISWVIIAMNGAVKMIAELPASTINEIYLSKPQFVNGGWIPCAGMPEAFQKEGMLVIYSGIKKEGPPDHQDPLFGPIVLTEIKENTD
jgi:competence protein ComEC